MDRSTLILILVITLTLVVSPSSGLNRSAEISSRGIISRPEEPNHLPRLHISNTEIKDTNENKMILAGINFDTSSWWTRGYGTEQQFIYMKEWGCNVARVEISAWAIESGLMKNSAFLERLDNMISWAEKHGIYVVLDGWHLSGTRPDGTLRNDLSGWGDAEWNAWIEHWKTVATRYKGKTNILYDLLNEPLYVKSRAVYQTQITACIDAIRAIDPEVIAIVEAMSTSGWGVYDFGLHWVETHPINRDNVVYSGHMYYDPPYTYAGTDYEFWTTEMRLRYWIYVLETGRCLWIGEFNACIDKFPESETWLQMMIPTWDKMGSAGYAAWWWNDEGRFRLLNDWNGNPSPSGSIIQKYLGG